MPSAGSSDRTRHCRANLSVVYLVCSYCRRLRDPMVQSFVMIVSFFFSLLPLPSAPRLERDLSTAIHTPVRLLRAWAPMMFALAASARSPSPWAPQSPGLELSHATTDVGLRVGWVGRRPGFKGRALLIERQWKERKNTHTPQALVPAMRVRCHIIISKSKPRSSLVSFCGGREGGAGPKEAVPDPPPCRAQVERGIIRSATINKLHIVSQNPMVSLFSSFRAQWGGFHNMLR